jgi:hypothetical protein
LRFSVRRKLRLFVAPADETERRQVIRASRCTLLDTSDAALAAVRIEHGWAALLRSALAAERPLDLTTIFTQARPNLTTAGLDQLGNELAVDLANGKLSRASLLRATDYHRITDSVHDADGLRVTLSPEALNEWRSVRDTRRENQALRDTKAGNKPAAPTRSPEPMPEEVESTEREPLRYAAADARRRSAPRGEQASHGSAATAIEAREIETRESAVACADPDVTDKLELLDDLVFEAIEGKREALAKLRKAWPLMLASLGAEAVEESRLLYVERATAVWAQHNSGVLRQPDLAAAALEVLTLILGGMPKLRG